MTNVTEKQVHILIVEDQPLWREQFFGEPLQDLGFHVSLAATKDEALLFLSQSRYDLAIIDINLTAVTGNTDGLLVVEKLQSTYPKTQIIIVSGTTDALRILQERQYPVFAQIHKAAFDLQDYLFLVKKSIALVWLFKVKQDIGFNHEAR